MRHVLEWVPLSRNEDVERFVGIVEKAIEEDRVDKCAAFAKTKGKVVLLPEDEKEEAEGFEELKSKMLTKRREDAGTLIQRLAKKYGADPEGNEGQDVGEEEFAAAQKRLTSKSKGIKKKRVAGKHK